MKTTISLTRPRAQSALAGTLALGVTLLCVPTAGAQPPDPPLAMRPLTAVPVLPPVVFSVTPPAAVTPAPPFWELVSGYEGDTHGSAHGFFGPSYVRPIRPGLAWTARAFASYLSYHFSNVNGATDVRSPGVSSAIGLQFGDTHFFRVLAGPEVKWRRTEVTASGITSTQTDARFGVNVGSEVYANPTPHNNIHGIVNYNTSDRYTWGRLGFKEQIGNRAWERPLTTFLGIEAIGQGNRDIRSRELGGFFEVSHAPAKVSLMFKAGYKRSTFDVGPAETGPYFSVGFYRRMN